jgi:hypothetical protein
MLATQRYFADTALEADHDLAFASVHAVPAEAPFPKVPSVNTQQERSNLVRAAGEGPWTATIAALQRLSPTPIPNRNVPDPVGDARNEVSLRCEP